jgi:hypothetical protein
MAIVNRTMTRADAMGFRNAVKTKTNKVAATAQENLSCVTIRVY